MEVRGPGAGGYGLPSQRDVQAVLQDVRCGFISVEAARSHYGVAIIDNEIDAPATVALRAAMPQTLTQHFDHGSARSAFERLWTPARYQLLTNFLAEAPVGWRHFLKTQVFRAVEASGEAADMADIFTQLRQRYPAMSGKSR